MSIIEAGFGEKKGGNSYDDNKIRMEGCLEHTDRKIPCLFSDP